MATKWTKETKCTWPMAKSNAERVDLGSFLCYRPSAIECFAWPIQALFLHLDGSFASTLSTLAPARCLRKSDGAASKLGKPTAQVAQENTNGNRATTRHKHKRFQVHVHLCANGDLIQKCGCSLPCPALLNRWHGSDLCLPTAAYWMLEALKPS